MAALVAAAVALSSAVLASRTAFRAADLASRTTLQSSYTQDRLKAAGHFLEAVDAVLDDPSPATKRRMRSQLLRVQLVFQSGVGPVEVAERIQFRAVGLMSNEALQENPEEKMLRELRSSADHEEAMLDDPRNSVPSDAVSLAWVRDRVMEIRSEDDRAVRAGKPEPDREQEIYEIENEFGQYGPPVGLSVSTLLGSAEARATRKKQLERDQKARHEMLRAAGNSWSLRASGWPSRPLSTRPKLPGLGCPA